MVDPELVITAAVIEVVDVHTHFMNVFWILGPLVLAGLVIFIVIKARSIKTFDEDFGATAMFDHVANNADSDERADEQ